MQTTNANTGFGSGLWPLYGSNSGHFMVQVTEFFGGGKLKLMTAFAPEYVKFVLNENFEDAKSLFLAPLMAIHYAHLVMLAAQGIVSPDDAHAMREALDAVSQEAVRRLRSTASARTCSSTWIA